MFKSSELYDSPVARFAGAAILGLSLTVVTRDIPMPTFALINEANWLRGTGIISGERLLFFVLLVAFGIHRSLFLVGALITLLTWIMMYSMVGAFLVTVITIALFGYFVLHRPLDERKSASAIMISLTFLVAAIQKMNPSYLSGEEFSRLGSFFGFLDYWNLSPYSWSETLVVKALPIVSILVELAIGIGVLLRPAVFSHLALLFTILLSFIHPSVLYVYAIIFPFAIHLDDKWSSDLSKSRMAAALQQPLTWAVFATFSSVRLITIGGAVFSIWPLSVILVVYHSRYLLKSLRHLAKDRVPWSFKNMGTGFVPPAFIVICGLAFQLGAPAPIGYSMFSGRKFRGGSHELRIDDKQACTTVQSRIMFSAVVDAGFGFHNENSCWIRFPTESGLRGVKSWLCGMSTDFVWTLIPRGRAEGFIEGCEGLPRKTNVDPVVQ